MLREQIWIPLILSLGFLALASACYLANEATAGRQSAVPAIAAALVLLFCTIAVARHIRSGRN